jgi:hypothetical protein
VKVRAVQLRDVVLAELNLRVLSVLVTHRYVIAGNKFLLEKMTVVHLVINTQSLMEFDHTSLTPDPILNLVYILKNCFYKQF